MASGAFAQAAGTAIQLDPMMYMKEYLEEKEARDQHPSTVRGAKNALHYFAEFCRSEGITAPEEIQRVHLIRFQAWCNKKVADGEWEKSYAALTLRKVQAWINWLVNLEYITHQPWHGIKIPKVGKKPNPLTDEELGLLVGAHRRDAFRIDPFIFHRREALLALLYGRGLRLHEVESLTVTQMDSRLDIVLVKNKGTDKPKPMMYTPELKSSIERWLHQRAKHAASGVDALLITTNGTPLTKEYMYTIIVKLGEDAGVKINPHRLRDTFGTHCLDDDMPVERLQIAMGHTTARQTLEYARVNDTKVYESLRDSMDPRLRNLFHNTRDLRSVD